MEKTPGNITRGTAANSCASFTGASATTRISARSTAAKRLPPRAMCRPAGGIFPGSWINANFDVWIGDEEDVSAWDLLWDAREAYGRGVDANTKGHTNAPTKEELAYAQESLLAAEGSDWCWWYGPEHSTANDAEFDALYRKHLTGIYVALGQVAPEELAKPIKRRRSALTSCSPSTILEGEEWMGGIRRTSSGWARGCIRRNGAAARCTGGSFI